MLVVSEVPNVHRREFALLGSQADYCCSLSRSLHRRQVWVAAVSGNGGKQITQNEFTEKAWQVQ